MYPRECHASGACVGTPQKRSPREGLLIQIHANCKWMNLIDPITNGDRRISFKIGEYRLHQIGTSVQSVNFAAQL
jgi:hypothetical protein